MQLYAQKNYFDAGKKWKHLNSHAEEIPSAEYGVR